MNFLLRQASPKLDILQTKTQIFGYSKKPSRIWSYQKQKKELNQQIVKHRRNFNFSIDRYKPSASALYHISSSDHLIGAYTIRPTYQIQSVRHFNLGHALYEQSSSKVEESVKKIQEKEKEKDQLSDVSATQTVVKKSIKQRIWEELVHYYHGFRLLFIDIKIAVKLVWKVLKGNKLTRREYMLLIRTTGDMFRLVPFSVFIVVPFMEFLLPLYIKFFPGLMPSTFETAKDRENKARNQLKVKLDMAKFLQKTLDEMDLHNKDHKSEEAKAFVEFFHKIRASNERATPEEIMKFSKLFEDEITLDSLSREQLQAICKVLEVSTIGTSNFLRFQLRMKLRTLAADDRIIKKEGIESLTLIELQNACRARGMRSYGLSEQQLRKQLAEWIDLSLNEKVPPSLLLLSRALMLPEDVPTADKLKAIISVLPDSAAIQAKAAIGEREGKIDNKTKIDILRDEERKIQEELDELNEVQKDKLKAEILVDPAPTIKDECSPLSTKDIEVVCDALGEVSKAKRTLLVEKEEIKDLKEEIADYKEDVQELQQISQQCPTAEPIKESTASKMLLKKVDSMIRKLDNSLAELEKKEARLQASIKEIACDEEAKKSELIQIDEIMSAIRKLQKVSDEEKFNQIQKMLAKMDDDQDGQLKIDDVLKIIETIGKDNVNLNEKQIGEIVELISKEDLIESEEKIVKALAKSKEERESEKKNQNECTNNEEDLIDTAKTICDDNKNEHEQSDDDKLSNKSKSKIDERINQGVILSADKTVERQKDILPPLSPSGDLPTSSPSGNANQKAKDKML